VISSHDTVSLDQNESPPSYRCYNTLKKHCVAYYLCVCDMLIGYLYYSQTESQFYGISIYKNHQNMFLRYV